MNISFMLHLASRMGNQDLLNFKKFYPQFSNQKILDFQEFSNFGITFYQIYADADVDDYDVVVK